MTGYIRVTNLRWSEGPKPDDDETVIKVDRTHPVLGNHAWGKKVRTAAERRSALAAHKIELDKDWEQQGPIYQEIVAIAKRVQAGEKVCLDCWCAPLPCHADNYVEKISLLLHQWAQETPKAETRRGPRATPRRLFSNRA